jgi:poly-gamma-glutamate synthesis protein (capsule biosynthesis protein)
MGTAMVLMISWLAFAFLESGEAEATGRWSAASPAPVPDRPGSLTIALVGDVQLGDVPEELLGENPPFGFDRVIARLRNADLAFANLECAITDRGAPQEKAFTFRAGPHRLTALKHWGIDAVSLANNHVLDYGSIGLVDTLRHLEEASIPSAGAGRTEAEAFAPVILEKNGVSVAYLAFSSINPLGGPGGLVAPIDEIRMTAAIKAARDHADIVIVSLHMGPERRELTPGQIAAARAAVAAGADIVHGHHPHCILGFERTDSGVIAYSLGNFLFANSGRSYRDAGLLEVTIRDRRVVGARIVPLRDKDGPGSCYIPLLADTENHDRIIKLLDGYSRPLGTRIRSDGAIIKEIPS